MPPDAGPRTSPGGRWWPSRVTAGCIKDHDAPPTPVTVPCPRAGRGLGGAKTIVLSPDGRYAYVASLNDDAIAAFRRNRRTGVLHQLKGRNSCIGGGNHRRRRECPRPAKGIHGIRWIAMSRDGRNIYAAAPAGDSIAAFRRSPRTGGLRQLSGADACIEDRLARVRSGCTQGVGLNYPRTIALSPDGTRAYVTGFFGLSVGVFRRDPATGRLSQLQGRAACVRDVTSREPCGHAVTGLQGTRNVVLSPDATTAYVPSSVCGAVTVFRVGRPAP
jgi:DNA-binding beta-propeller fold protein YncE